MNIMDVALKDLKRVFRSAFALIMMFGAPLLIAGLLYFAFGGLASGNGSFSLPRTRVIIANLDNPSTSASTFKAGEMLVQFLQNKDLADVLEITIAPDEASAHSAIDQQQADVALIIPANFTNAALTPGQDAAVTLYQDPTLTIGPGIVKDLVNHFVDGFSGAKIAAKVSVSAMQDGMQSAPDLAESAMVKYATYLNSSDHDVALHVVLPSGESKQTESGLTMIGPIMASMLILFVFFMGANGAQSIIREHEEGTLARLFTTPLPKVTLLSGKFLAIFVTLTIQAGCLAVSALIFHIWGPLPVIGTLA
jgi:ABC-type Na+ efflux pump permease subunit